jgi:energy-coupling factor transport system ATP-binding protein
LSEKDIKIKVEETLDAVGLTDKKNAFPPALSRLCKIKTVFASILVMGPKIIMLDEPIAGQDNQGCRNIMDIISQLHQNACTIILVTHNISIAAEYSQRIIVMKKSRLFMDGKPLEIFGQTEKLFEAGILPPQITRLSRELRKHIPLKNDALVPSELADMLITGYNYP